MEKRKLLIATDNFLPRWDGIARFLAEIIPRLKEVYDITVLAPDFKGDYDEEEDVKVIRIPLKNMKFGDFQPAKFERGIIKEAVKETDIVWTQTIGPIGGLAVLEAKKSNKSLVAFIHSFESELVSESIAKKKITKWFLKKTVERISVRLYNKCDLLLVPSPEIASILSWQKIHAPKVVVYLGTDTNKFIPAKDKNYAKSKVNINPNKIVIGYTGRIAREKDLRTLYRAFARLEKKYDNLQLLIVGGGLKEMEDFLKSKKNVIVTGPVNNVISYLQAMDIYVLPSLTETSSLSTMEAMSCGLAVAATKVGYVKNYIKDKRNGLLFPKRNSLVLSMKLEWLINNEILRKKIGENARKTIISQFSWERTVEGIKKVLERF